MRICQFYCRVDQIFPFDQNQSKLFQFSTLIWHKKNRAIEVWNENKMAVSILFSCARVNSFNCVARIKKSLICIIFRGLNTTYICLGSSVCLCIHENYFWKMSRCKKCESWFFWESVPLWSTDFEEVYVKDTEKWNYVQTMYTYFVQIPKELSIKFWWCSYW